MSILFYCNFSSQQYELSATFRRIYWNESDEALKKRHSYFANWSRLLRETVECFGTMMGKSPVKIFYHGISKEMIFQSVKFCIYGPLSTTADFQIAHGTFAKTEGLVVDIWNNNAGNYLFDCSFFSDYTDENERFFIGGLQYFEFITIHHMKLKEDYMAWIKPISVLAKMFSGFPFERSRVKNIDISGLSLLILNYLSSSTTSEICQIPIYISKLFTNFVNNVEQIEINMDQMNCHTERARHKQFGYKLLKPLFFLVNDNTNSETINYSKLLQIFKRKLKTI
eukprot:363322_1